MKEISLIIPNFNQFYYLKNLVNQWKFYNEGKIYVLDNASTYKPLLDYYWQNEDFTVFKYQENDFVKNLKSFLSDFDSEYYVISDPDISLHPATPPNFLEIFKAIIDIGIHHIGFDLISHDIPNWNPKAGWIDGDNLGLRNTPYSIEIAGRTYKGWKAPIDTTFAMYKKSNGGWSAPMPGEHWSNSVRIFEAYHLPWYEHKDYLNEERKFYYENVLKRDNSKPSAGRNHFQPFTGME